MAQARKIPSGKLSSGYRIAMFGLAIVLLYVLLVARTLEPDSRGYGTHEQLGLTPCLFQQYTGYVCPTCGATTAWAYAVRGQWTHAATTNLGGTLLCFAAVITAPWLLLSASVGRWIVGRPSFKTLLITATALLVVVLLDWLQRVFLG